MKKAREMSRGIVRRVHGMVSGTLPLVPLIVSLSVLLISNAFGSGGGEGHGEKSLFQAYLWPVVNFLVLVFLMVYMLKKMDIKGYFRKRTELIEQTLREAREAKELAQKALAEVEERLRVKDKEIEEIIASSKYSGEREKARLIEEGDRLRDRILEQTRNNIAYEVKKAKEAIKEEAVEIAMELAEKKIMSSLSREQQVKLLEESVMKIEGKK